MLSHMIIKFLNEYLINVALSLVLPTMILAFFVGLTFRIMTYYTIKRHDWFAREFEKRVQKFIEDENPAQAGSYSFFSLSKKMLEKTYYEIFEVRDRLSRRRNDRFVAMGDRVFLIKQGMAWLTKDLLNQIKFLRWNDQNPKLLNITKNTFQKNPCFNHIFGIIPVGRVHDILQILPSLFVIGGIFGTFLGIVKGLPSLGRMDLSNMEVTKQIMDQFLLEISFAMNSSIVGIFFSVSMTFLNTLFSPDTVFVDVVDRFECALDMLWYRSNNNMYPVENGRFDEHRDPVEALAEQAVKEALQTKARSRDLDRVKAS